MLVILQSVMADHPFYHANTSFSLPLQLLPFGQLTMDLFFQQPSLLLCYLLDARLPICTPTVTLYDTPLQHKTSGKFLTLIFDTHLTWKEPWIKLSALKTLCLLQTLSHTCCADRQTFLHLHLCLVLSKLDYGCYVYSSASASFPT